MGYFNVIETFFFISLGITIILVALLVYHFKQRVNVLETKYESLFDIVSNVVKQLRNMQSAPPPPEQVIPQWPFHMPQLVEQQMHLGNISMAPMDIQSPYDYSNHEIEHNMYPHSMNMETVVEENDDDDDVSEESDSTVDNDVENENNDAASYVSSEHSDESSESEEEEEDASSEDESDDASDIDSVDSDNVKIITLPSANDIYELPEPTELDIEVVEDREDELYELPVQDIQMEDVLPVEDTESIVITKLESSPVETVAVVSTKPVVVNDLYKKMTLANLKATVISKGLCSDPSKMKKNELLKLLEEAQ
jgi:hypothetical protein